MNDALNPTLAAREAVLLDSEGFRELRTAQERARNLRDEAIARERERLLAVAAALDITPAELLGLPAKRGRGSKAPAA